VAMTTPSRIPLPLSRERWRREATSVRVRCHSLRRAICRPGSSSRSPTRSRSMRRSRPQLRRHGGAGGTHCRHAAAQGVGRGDRVVHLGLNSPELLELLFACAGSARSWCRLNWRLTANEHRELIADAEPRLPGGRFPASRSMARSISRRWRRANRCRRRWARRPGADGAHLRHHRPAEGRPS